MTKKISMCFMGIITLIGAVVFADQCIDGKFYVEPGSVYIAPDGIFLNSENNFIPINGVYVDAGGIYVLEIDCASMVRCQNPNCRIMVRCPYCLKMYDAETQQGRCPHNPIWDGSE